MTKRIKEKQKSMRTSQEVAAEGLLLLQQSWKVDVETQASPPVRKTAVTQASAGSATPSIRFYYLPAASGATKPNGRKLLEGNDECTKFYTGLYSIVVNLQSPYNISLYDVPKVYISAFSI